MQPSLPVQRVLSQALNRKAPKPIKTHTLKTRIIMANPQKIHIDARNTGLWKKVKQTDEVAKKTTELLQHDLEVRNTSPTK